MFISRIKQRPENGSELKYWIRFSDGCALKPSTLYEVVTQRIFCDARCAKPLESSCVCDQVKKLQILGS